MSFRNYKEKIDEGDTVILYLSNNLHAIEVRPEIKNKKGEMVENVYQTTFGALKVRNLIGSDYGSRVELSKGWGHVLQPTPELWSLTLPHRTQIIYTPDISMILLQLDLVPGCIVVEAGTGSGSLTHALIRRVRPHGHVHTFDFHDHRAKVAQEEFEEHGLAEFVTARHRDVLEDGFGDELNGKADAVFLDLPKPWAGIPHAVTAIKDDGGRFCSFSPCIEQVQRTCLALEQHGFQDISTMEVLQSELKVSRRTVPVRDLSFLKHKESKNPVEEKPSSEKSYVVGAWPASTPGHTGYLTVATLPPSFTRRKTKPIKSENSNETPNGEDMKSNIEETMSVDENNL
ncbi:tRNA (adenine(58)-N(1))-methyltransferase catalytic subunit TRMT61A isoform X1 [Maniola jurtina]|uniref:tRNA (adenine(58)-N(1))-methyltransferase catalytic subunit TRMT61A isoform X1 n=1 Tax=Maniola jurtina TaxID=191418 RepID=UPI001E688A1A|nr:tRNA (adenine(58)-N(1))-methyltransferase catalytic subunit TRMT61A isoform X1 [Maniola jurtina]